MHEKEQRDVDPCTEAAVCEATVREANASRLNELGWRGVVRVVTRRGMVRRGVNHHKSPSRSHAGQAFIPPSTVRFAPVMCEDSGPAINATIEAMSSTCP